MYDDRLTESRYGSDFIPGGLLSYLLGSQNSGHVIASLSSFRCWQTDDYCLYNEKWNVSVALRANGNNIILTRSFTPQEPELTLIHIPIELYSSFIQPIFRLLFGEDHDEDAANIPWTSRHDFLNISITTVECSIICEKRLADMFFSPLLKQHNTRNGYRRTSNNEAEMTSETYIVIQVDGQGLDAGQRVLELTSPLARAGM